jgi:hypothetical protein
MALQFPSNPSVGQIYQQWVWDGAIWLRGGTGVTVDGLPPPSPLQGDLWWRTTVGQLFVYYKENGQSQWVIANSGGGSWPPMGVTDGSNAPPGAIGEYLSVSSTGYSQSSNTWMSPTNLTLAAGDWDVSGFGFWQATAVTNVSVLTVGLHTAPNVQPPYGQYFVESTGGTISAGNIHTLPIYFRFNLTASTQIWINTMSGFSSGGLTTSGLMRARRMR